MGGRNLSLGKSDHGGVNYFQGCMYNAGILNSVGIKQAKKVSFRLSGPEDVRMPIVSNSIINFESVTLHVHNY